VEGRTPNKPFKGSFNVRLRPELHMKAAMFAEERDMKLNAVINDALQEYIEKAV
jgi:predicted HicB family RNase H-like nuclease